GLELILLSVLLYLLTLRMLLTVFPAKSIAGVIQLSFLNDQNQPEYGFNVTEARDICTNLGLNLASKDQVTEALNRGFETCRFGWIDEHYAVVPRIKALAICGQNQTGLVSWRAALDKKFDVFCFNQSGRIYLLFKSAQSILWERFVTCVHYTKLMIVKSRMGPMYLSCVIVPGKVVLITSACAVLLVAIAVLAYMKV
uniref:Link domain-containing protein n=1 Tax=Hippocampus comes TaxID=109280 RepID=A0A3Q2XB15_HIPCM